MRIAFYAPLKPIDHPVPSGDRAMARSLIGVLRELGHEVFVASRLRTFDRDGNAKRQYRLANIGRRIGERLVARFEREPKNRPDLWFTYHVYHKSPDWIGPLVADRLRIPYIVAEPSVAGKRRDGPWALGYQGALAAIHRADGILAITRRDQEVLDGEVADPGIIGLFPPFIDTRPYTAEPYDRERCREAIAREFGLETNRPWLLAVGMMRDDAKLKSFELILHTLDRLWDQGWQMLLVGDGPSRMELAALAMSLGLQGRIAFAGERTSSDLVDIYRAADLYVWPGVDEAYGIAILEAQAAGLPVIAGAEGGIPEIVEHEVTGMLVEPRQTMAFATAIAMLLSDPQKRRAMGQAAARSIRHSHDRSTAISRMGEAIARAQRAYDRRWA